MEFKDRWLACVSFGEQTFRTAISDQLSFPERPFLVSFFSFYHRSSWFPLSDLVMLRPRVKFSCSSCHLSGSELLLSAFSCFTCHAALTSPPGTPWVPPSSCNHLWTFTRLFVCLNSIHWRYAFEVLWHHIGSFIHYMNLLIFFTGEGKLVLACPSLCASVVIGCTANYW